jgi:hypothetical protein
VDEVDSAASAGAPELAALRANVREAEGRIDRATRQLELAAEIEARLQVPLEEQPGQGPPRLHSLERQTAELEATWILLQAELRAAKILNGSGRRDHAGTYKPAAINPDKARALEDHLAQLADIEAALAATARQLVRRESELEQGSPGPARNGGPARPLVRPAGPSVPVPLIKAQRARLIELETRARELEVQVLAAQARLGELAVAGGDGPSEVEKEQDAGLVPWAEEEAVAIVQDARRRAAELEPGAEAQSELADLERLLVRHFELHETLVSLLSEIAP